MLKRKEQFKKQLGFNIIEILIMISLVALTFVAIMSLAIKNVQLQQLSKNDYVAISLAKEGLELVEEIRNDNIKVGNLFFEDVTCSSWGCDVMPIIDEWTCHYRVDYVDARGATGVIRTCYDPALPPVLPEIADLLYALKFDDVEYYQLGNGDDSQFHRMITTKWHVGDYTGPYITVTSDVYWEYKGQGYTYSLETKLFDYDW